MSLSFSLFFPFRHLLPRENFTIGRSLRMPSHKVDHSDLNCCIVKTYFGRMDNTDKAFIGVAGLVTNKLGPRCARGAADAAACFPTPQTDCERAGSSKKWSKKGTAASEPQGGRGEAHCPSSKFQTQNTAPGKDKRRSREHPVSFRAEEEFGRRSILS